MDVRIFPKVSEQFIEEGYQALTAKKRSNIPYLRFKRVWIWQWVNEADAVSGLPLSNLYYEIRWTPNAPSGVAIENKDYKNPLTSLDVSKGSLSDADVKIAQVASDSVRRLFQQVLDALERESFREQARAALRHVADGLVRQSVFDDVKQARGFVARLYSETYYTVFGCSAKKLAAQLGWTRTPPAIAKAKTAANIDAKKKVAGKKKDDANVEVAKDQIAKDKSKNAAKDELKDGAKDSRKERLDNFLATATTNDFIKLDKVKRELFVQYAVQHSHVPADELKRCLKEEWKQIDKRLFITESGAASVNERRGKFLARPGGYYCIRNSALTPEKKGFQRAVTVYKAIIPLNHN